MRALTLLLLAHVATAQPSGSALLDSWEAQWRASAARISAVSMDESIERVFVGPRGERTIEVDARLRYDLEDGGRRPDRTVRRITVDGREMSTDREVGEGRLGRAFGPAGREIAAPPLFPNRVLEGARARSVEADRQNGVSAWRVGLEVGARRGTDAADAWFARDNGRLLRLRIEGRRPQGGRIERDIRFTRVSGLDLPSSATAEFTVRQRRRLREYVVTLTSSATYRGHSVR